MINFENFEDFLFRDTLNYLKANTRNLGNFYPLPY